MKATIKEVSSYTLNEIIDTYLGLAGEFFEQQLYEKTENTLLLALNKFPHDPTLLVELAELYIKLDMPEKALYRLNQLIRYHRGQSHPYFLRARIFEQRDSLNKAINDYKRALENSDAPLAVLVHLVPLLLRSDRAEEALEYAESYQKVLSHIYQFVELHARILLKLDRRSQAFNVMRCLLLQKPSSTSLLKRYLQLALVVSKKTPVEIYKLLKLAIPNLSEPRRTDLLDLEVDYLVRKQRWENALKKVKELLKLEPGSYKARKQRILIKCQLKEVRESMAEAKLLFLENPDDVEVRGILEMHYVENQGLDAWKELLRRILQKNPQQTALFQYLCSLETDNNWLGSCPLSYEAFMDAVEELDIVKSNIHDITYQKLPLYALETFVRYVVISGEIYSPEVLWEIICKEREKKQQIPPFQLEDLQAVYPIWLFGLHIYFLFKNYSDYEVAFKPRAFQYQQIAAFIKNDGGLYQVDISYLLKKKRRKLKTLLKVPGGRRWRWQFEKPTPERMLHEISFYSASQFKVLLADAGTVLAEAAE